MFLCVDIGNSHTTIGLLDAGDVLDHWRVATEPRRTADEWTVLLRGLLDGSRAGTTPHGVALCATVPSVLHEWREMLAGYFTELPHLVVEPGVKTGVPVLTDNPREVGADRIVNTLAAYTLYGGPAIVVDFGTATTFDVVDTGGAYKGGIIAPGLNLSLDALVSAAAKLPRIAIEEPRSNSVIGRTTEDQMIAGIYWGYVALIEGLLDRLKKEIGRPVTIVGTGGLAALFDKRTELFDAVEPDLTIQGLSLLYERLSAGA